MVFTGWCCFKFWFCWRLVMALLSHFNWYTAYARINCFYFTAWKSYDMLWFWSHLALCICFKPLRRGNYLLVFVNLLWAKRKYPHRSFEQIYDNLYNKHKYTKSERELRSIEAAERGDAAAATTTDVHNQPAPHPAGNNADAAPPRNDASSDGEEQEQSSSPTSQQIFPPLAVAAEMAEDGEKAADMPRIYVKRTSPPNTRPRMDDNAEGQALLSVVAIDASSEKELTPSVASVSSRSTASRLASKLPFGIPFLRHTGISAEGPSEGDAKEQRHSKEQKDEQIAAEKEEKQRQRELHRAEKAARKEANSRRKAELRRLAKIERRRRRLSDAIDLLLTWLRLGTTFAIMLGNFHKAVLPKFMKAPGEYVADTPDMLMLFMITMMVDILLFWLSMFWTYMQQCRLCCRLGPFRFWLWLIALGFFGGVCMYAPMHFVHQQLDPTWCVFRPDTPLSEYMDG